MSLSTLCLSCGLCCDGTLFRQVAITPEERVRLEELRIGTGRKRGGDVMPLPCGKLVGTCCSIYEARPGGCRRFVCALGRRLQGNELSLHEAQLHVRDMHERLEVLRQALGLESSSMILRTAREAIDGAAPVPDGVTEAFKRVEDLRYEVFMPPPQPE
ncbi:MAG: zinc/iron-chelating domain-containing protein [Archangium gephyra]|uniref:Zinc/iron-chelating domain-containing protein n=1 Tax=Archangium gephyra TaxID=48 RepID=A0A2W5UNG9_9BACT|nr:MAG: zinc/iron-chelating domain-containing protein [Archangium gephyra]